MGSTRTLVIRIDEAADGWPVEARVWPDGAPVIGKLPRDLPPDGAGLFAALGEAGVSAIEDRDGLRTVLDLRADPLRALAWEQMSGPHPLFLDARNPVMRGSWIPASMPPPVDLPLRMLVLVGCETDDSVVKWREELAALRATLRRLRHAVDVVELVRPDAATWADAWRRHRPHVFHFIGHGDADPRSGRPALQIHDERADQRWWLTADRLAPLVAEQPPRLVFLNACRTGGGGLWDLVRAFESAGAAAVIAMLGDIRGEAACTFADVVYGRLAEGRHLDAAVALAREKVRDRHGDADWSRPCLHVWVPPEAVLSLPPAARRAQLQRSFREVHDFVNREAERRHLWRAVDPLPAVEGAPHRLMVVRGPSDIGKTALALWVLEGCALRGRAVRYVDLRRFDRTLRFLDVLHAIRDGEPRGRDARSSLPETAFRRFNQRLNAWFDGVDDTIAEPAGQIADRTVHHESGTDEVINRLLGIEGVDLRLFEAFRAALATAAGGAPLILVLDHLDRVLESDFHDWLYPYLLDPIARGEVADVRVVIPITPDRAQRIRLDEHVLPEQVLTLGALPAEDFESLARSFFDHHGLPYPEEDLGPAFATKVRALGHWKPTMLHELKRVVGLFGP